VHSHAPLCGANLAQPVLGRFLWSTSFGTTGSQVQILPLRPVTDFPSPTPPSKAKTGRPALGPRLYLRGDEDGIKRWIIRDLNRDLRTGCSEGDLEGAQQAIEAYHLGQQIPSRSDSIPGYVYFVTCTTSLHYPLKIGWAKNVAGRLVGMQGANPNLLTVLAAIPGTYRDERNLHARFRHLHIRGEWFRAGADLLEYVASLPGYSESYGADEFAPSPQHYGEPA
jgi:hypothetical protein